MRRWFRRIAAGVILVAAILFAWWRLPRPIDAVGTLGQCAGGWALVAFEGETWKDAMPPGLGTFTGGQIPVATWPDGLSYDEATGVVFDPSGQTAYRNGDRLRLRGTVIEVHGDPSPCYVTVGVRIESISVP